ncbi:MAG: hypothetical protein HQK51_20470, partial [Oligoflexia bacterium]|nr:hypothetical protein [Oligoflexia bacterium]
MALNAVDYSKDLAREKAEYQRSIKDSSEAHKKDMERMQKMHEMRENLVSENYRNAKLDTEDSYQKRIGSIEEQNQKVLEKLHEEYPRKLALEREVFQNTAEEQKKNFRREIDNISDALQRANKYEKEEHEAVQNNTMINNRQRSESMAKKHNDQLAFMQEIAQKSEGASRQRRIDENEKINKEHQLEINDLRKNETNKRMDQVRTKENQLKITKDEWDSDKKLSKERQEDVLDSYKQKNDIIVENMRNNFNKLAGDYREEMVGQEEGSKIGYQKELSKMGDQYRQDMETMGKKIQTMQKERNSKKMNPSLYEDKMYDQTLQHEKNVRELNGNFNKRLGEIRDSYTSDLAKTKEADSARENARVGNLSEYVAKSIAKKEEDNGKIVELYRKKDKDQTKFYQQYVDNITDIGERRSKKNLEEFNNTIGNMSKKNKESMDKLREQFGDEQRAIIMKDQQEKAEIITIMKDQHNKKINQDNENHRLQLNSRDLKMQEFEENMNNKIEEAQKNKVLDDRYKNILFESSNKQNAEVVRRALENKDVEDKAKMDEMRKNYEDKIYESEKKNNAKIRQLTSDSKR